MLKVGDKLLCKKKRRDFISENYYYKIVKISENNVYVLDTNSGLSVGFHAGDYDNDYYNLSDYFYTKKEILNKKLKKCSK